MAVLELTEVEWYSLPHKCVLRTVPEFSTNKVTGKMKKNKRAGMRVCEMCGIEDEEGKFHPATRCVKKFTNPIDAERFKQTVVNGLNRVTRKTMPDATTPVKFAEYIQIQLLNGKLVSCIRLLDDTLLMRRVGGKISTSDNGINWMPFYPDDYVEIGKPTPIYNCNVRGEYHPLLTELKEYIREGKDWTTGKSLTVVERRQEKVGRHTGTNAEEYYSQLMSRQFAKSTNVKIAEDLIAEAKHGVEMRNMDKTRVHCKLWASNTRTNTLRIRKELSSFGAVYTMYLRVIYRAKYYCFRTRREQENSIVLYERDIILAKNNRSLPEDTIKAIPIRYGKFMEEWNI